MTLTQTLNLQEKYLQYDDLRALDYCEKRWKEAGEPTERWQVINFLERMLQELKSQGGYPKVLLFRKKQIQRREFSIQQPGETPAEGCSCFDGWRMNGTPCPCPKGDARREELRKMGMQV
jgi:hypothetical protein